jgi:hypothetical protein
MQRYSGIFMGRRKKQTSEIEAEMEGSGDDREPQGLAYLAAEFHKTLTCYPRYLGITRRSCLEAHMVLDMEYESRIDLSMALEGPSFLLLSHTCPASSTSLHHYRPGLASEKALAP